MIRSLWERAVIYRLLLQSKEGNKIGLGWVLYKKRKKAKCEDGGGLFVKLNFI